MAEQTQLPDKQLRIAVVGPCAAGKSTLAAALKAAGYETRQPAQEHSYVPNMWQRLTHPDILIYLDVNYDHVKLRRPHDNGGQKRLMSQHQQLLHARVNCDFYLDTSGLSPVEVQEAVLYFLHKNQ